MQSNALQVEVETTSGRLTIRNRSVLKRGERAVPVALTFTENEVPTRREIGAAFILGIKALGNFTGPLLASCDTWTRGATDDDPYTGTLDLSGEDLDTLIANSNSLSCIAEVTWPAGSSLFAPVSIQNDVNRENDAPPVPSVGFARRVYDLLVEGDNTKITFDEVTGKITITATGGPSPQPLTFAVTDVTWADSSITFADTTYTP